MSNSEVELDQHSEAGRQISALLSAALAAAQAAAQVAAQRARDTSRESDQQTRQSQQLDAAAQRQLERQQRTEQSVRHRQWGLAPSAEWLHDNPLSAASAWASADVHRGDDPVAARHADQWETVYKREGIAVDDVRTNAPAAVAAAEQQQNNPAASSTSTQPVEVAGELAAAEVATGAVVAGAVDVAAAEAAEYALSTASASHWSAYADGAPAAALGGRGVSTPPSQVLAKVRETPDLAATSSQGTARAAELVTSSGVER